MMSPQARENTCKNTAKYLSCVKYDEIKKKYLAQLYNIAPDYARGVYELLPDPGFDVDEVAKLAEGAHLWYKEKKFRPTGEKLVGFAPGVPVYNV